MNPCGIKVPAPIARQAGQVVLQFLPVSPAAAAGSADRCRPAAAETLGLNGGVQGAALARLHLPSRALRTAAGRSGFHTSTEPMKTSAAATTLSLGLLMAALALPIAAEAAPEVAPEMAPEADASQRPGAKPMPMPAPAPCADGSSPAERGKTTGPGSPGSQSGALPAAGVASCTPTGTPHPVGKTTDPGSRGSQSGAKPAVPAARDSR